MNICEAAPAITQGRELQEASPALNLFCKLFAVWHEVGTLFKNGLSTFMVQLKPPPLLLSSPKKGMPGN